MTTTILFISPLLSPHPSISIQSHKGFFDRLNASHDPQMEPPAAGSFVVVDAFAQAIFNVRRFPIASANFSSVDSLMSSA
jgi:hypothetical protein